MPVRFFCDRCKREFDSDSTSSVNNSLLCVDCYAGWKKVWDDFLSPSFTWARTTDEPVQTVPLPTDEKKQGKLDAKS